MIHRNRLANVKNEFQGPAKRVLCVCSAGMLRSPTAAWVLSNPPFNFNTRSVGTSQEFALIPVDEVHIKWADEIVVMSREQADVIWDIFPENVKPLIVLDIPDNFSFRDPKLVEIMTEIFLEEFKDDINKE